MKKLKFFAIALTILISATLFASCGGGDSAETTVTEQEWGPLLNSLYDGNYNVVSDSDYYSTVLTVTDNLIKESATYDGETHTQYYENESGATYVYESVGEVWYKHPYVSSNWNNGVFDGYTLPWETCYFRNVEGLIDDVLPLELLEYNLFTYDDENGVYFAESIEIKYDNYPSDFLKNIRISFSDGKLLGISFEFCDNTEGNPVYTVAFYLGEEYIDISLPDAASVVTLPTDYSNTQETVTTIGYEFDWQNAVVSFQLSNKIHIVSERASATILKDKIKVFVDGETTYYEKNDNKYSVYSKEDGSWVMKDDESEWQNKVEEVLALYSGVYANFFMPELYDGYKYFEYDEETQCYTIDEYESEGGDFAYKNVSVSFENGEILSLTFDCEFGGEWLTVQMSRANDNSITIPEVTE